MDNVVTEEKFQVRFKWNTFAVKCYIQNNQHNTHT